jgi:hypothetical protein
VQAARQPDVLQAYDSLKEVSKICHCCCRRCCCHTPVLFRCVCTLWCRSAPTCLLFCASLLAQDGRVQH